jgi:hypothetical protein
MNHVRFSLAALASAASCTTFPEPTANSVVTVTLSPASDAEASCPADSFCQMTAHVCLGASEPNPAVTATLTLSSGTWLIATVASSPASAVVALGTGCTDALFQVGAAAGPVFVQATVGTYSNTGSAVLVAAPVSEVSIVPSAIALSSIEGGTASFGIQAVAVPAPPGRALSTGTRFQFSVSNIQPSGTDAIVAPDDVPVDMTGTAMTSIFADPTVTSVTIKAMAVSADGVALNSSSYAVTSQGP